MVKDYIITEVEVFVYVKIERCLIWFKIIRNENIRNIIFLRVLYK